MNLVDHPSLAVPNIVQATQFYDGLMSTLGYRQLAANERFAACGVDSVQFLDVTPEEGESCSAGNGTHICFVAPIQAQVDDFHRYTMVNGGAFILLTSIKALAFIPLQLAVDLCIDAASQFVRLFFHGVR